MTTGKKIRQRRKALGISVDELAAKIGKDRSTIYRYENGAIESIPVEMLFVIANALDTTPQSLTVSDAKRLNFEKHIKIPTIATSNEWLKDRAERWFDATGGYEFNDDELQLFYEIAKYLMNIRDTVEYEENMQFISMIGLSWGACANSIK